MRKPKLTTAKKKADSLPEPEEYDYMFENGSGRLSVFQRGNECELWRKYRRKYEPMGVGYRTESGYWGLVCNRHPVPRIIALKKTLKDAFEAFCNVYDPV